jgi:hypothetical protein
MTGNRAAFAAGDGSSGMGRYVKVKIRRDRLADCATLPLYVFRSSRQPYRWWEDEPPLPEQEPTGGDEDRRLD